MAKDQNESVLPDLNVGEVFTVYRENNRSTGFEWRLIRLEKLALLNVDFRYENEVHAKGAPGRTTWVLQAIEEGQGAIQFAKYRTFEPEGLLYDDVLPYTIGPALPDQVPLEPGPVVPPIENLFQRPGGWSVFAKPTKFEIDNVFKPASPGVGVDYTPLLVSKQRVNGANYIFLANAKIPGISGSYAVAFYVFAGGTTVKLEKIKRIGQPSGGGRFHDFVEFKEDSEAAKALKSAFTHHVGLDFTPLYSVAQTVAGTNYLFAGNGHSVVQHPTERPMLVLVYQPLDGSASITSVEDIVEL
jgi:predicted secreted protein